MNTDESQIAPAPPAYPHRELTEHIIGAAYEVHNQLGSGFLEKVYETALSHELKTRGIHSVSQAEITVCYKGLAVGSYYGDLVVDGKVLCEIKAVERLIPAHEAQLLNYLKATGIKIGLLLNFGSGRLQVRRMAF